MDDKLYCKCGNTEFEIKDNGVVCIACHLNITRVVKFSVMEYLKVFIPAANKQIQAHEPKPLK